MAQKKYILTDETIMHKDVKLYRIKSLDPSKTHWAGANGLGGFVESEDNLSHTGQAWIADNAKVWGNAKVSDNALVRNFAQVCGNAQVRGKAHVVDRAQVFGSACVEDLAEVKNNAKVYGNSIVKGHACILDSACISGEAYVRGDMTLGLNARIALESDCISISPIGFEDTTLTMFRTAGGVGIARGSFFGTLDEFEEAVKEIHKKNRYAKEYKLLIKLARIRSKRWKH